MTTDVLTATESIVAATLGAGTPLVFAALGELVTERSGVLNLGVEGTMLVGALAAFATTSVTGHVWLGVVAGMAAGGGDGAHVRRPRAHAPRQPGGDGAGGRHLRDRPLRLRRASPSRACRCRRSPRFACPGCRRCPSSGRSSSPSRRWSTRSWALLGLVAGSSSDAGRPDPARRGRVAGVRPRHRLSGDRHPLPGHALRGRDGGSGRGVSGRPSTPRCGSRG